MEIRREREVICDAEVASSLWARVKGLMGRRLGEDEGLLMVFPRSGLHSLWMAGMRHPIDICFLDEEKRVVGVVKKAEPLSLHPRTWKLYFPPRPAKYVLEISPGSSLGEGDSISWGKA